MEQTGQSPRPPPGRLAFFRDALRLGWGAFGSSQRMQGPLETALVRERRWVTEEEHAALLRMLDLFPGAPSANTLALVGQRLGGWTWSVLGYVGFVLPGILVTAVVAWLYVRFDLGTRLEPLFRGFGGASVGAILALTLRRVRGAVQARWQMAVAGAALLLTIAGKASPTEVVLLGAATGLFVELGLRRRRAPGPRVPPPPSEGTSTVRSVLLAALPALAVVHFSGLDGQVVQALVLYFRTGLGAYGGGVAIIPHLSERLDALEWLTRRQLADGVSVALLTPGPVLLLATFAGYLHHGWAGSAASTFALLASPWALVQLAGGWLARVREHPVVQAAASGLLPAVAGLMGSAAVVLGESFHGPVSLAIAAASALTLVRYDLNPAWIIAAGGVLRFALHLVGV
ncbi:MAG TPA: chromate transporter [Myxococcaceae bacterium]|nr:chromate transporter [Myxococcaceae bacterium]